MLNVNGVLLGIRLWSLNARLSVFRKQKKEHFDHSFIKNFAHLAFNQFSFMPSRGASGGTIIVWKGSIFDGILIFQNDFA